MVSLIKYGALSGGEKYNTNILEIDGLSTDTKPITTFIEYGIDGREIGRTNIENGSTFTEIDTGKLFMYDVENTVWYEIETSGGGGSGGTTNYNSLSNKPQINGTTLSGNKTSDNLGLQNKISATNKIDSDFVDDENSANKFMSEAEKTKLASLVNYDDTEVKEDISDIETSLNSHKSDKANPHEVTKAQVGLGNVDNTSDANKPISTATQAALDNKVDKVDGKGLSANDFTDTDKAQITTNKNGIAALANSKQDNLTFDTAPTSGSTNPVTSGGLFSMFRNTVNRQSTIGGTGDLNDAKVSGFYKFNGSPANAPGTGTSSYGMLIVFDYDNYILQLCYRFDTSVIYIRASSSTGSSWGAWKELQSGS